LVRKAEKGDAAAQYQLGCQYRQGTHVEKNYAKALQWFEKAAFQGHVEAQHRVAICYNNGEGTLPDRFKAYAWYLIAAKNGNEYAQAKQRVYEAKMGRRQLAHARHLAQQIMEKISVRR